MSRLVEDEGFDAESEIRVIAPAFRAVAVVKCQPSRYGVMRYVELASTTQSPRQPGSPGAA